MASNSSLMAVSQVMAVRLLQDSTSSRHMAANQVMAVHLLQDSTNNNSMASNSSPMAINQVMAGRPLQDSMRHLLVLLAPQANPNSHQDGYPNSISRANVGST